LLAVAKTNPIHAAAAVTLAWRLNMPVPAARRPASRPAAAPAKTAVPAKAAKTAAPAKAAKIATTDAPSKRRAAAKKPTAPAPSAPRDVVIAQLAYSLAEARGFAPGRELDDWLAAEAHYEAMP
jgi:Protein of unknown function (DUF2934)